MKKNWLLTTLLATVTIAMGTTTTAFAAHLPTSLPNIQAGLPRLTAPTESPRILRDQVRPAGPLQSGSQ